MQQNLFKKGFVGCLMTALLSLPLSVRAAEITGSEAQWKAAAENVRLLTTATTRAEVTDGSEALQTPPSDTANWKSAATGAVVGLATLGFYKKLVARSFGSLSGPLVMGATASLASFSAGAATEAIFYSESGIKVWQDWELAKAGGRLLRFYGDVFALSVDGVSRFGQALKKEYVAFKSRGEEKKFDPLDVAQKSGVASAKQIEEMKRLRESGQGPAPEAIQLPPLEEQVHFMRQQIEQSRIRMISVLIEPRN